MKKTSNSIVSNTKEKRKNKLSKLKVSATVFALLCSSMFLVNDKHIVAEEPNYQGASFETGAYQHDAPAPYGFNYSQNSQYASTNTNKVNWRYTVQSDGTNGNQQFWGKPAIDKDGIVYMNNQNGNMYAFNRDGTVKWKLPVSLNNKKTNIISSDGTIYNSSGKLYAINPDGTEKWVAKPTSSDSNQHKFSEPAIDKDGTIYMLNDTQYDEKLYAFNPDGTLKFKGTTDLSTFGTTIPHENGMLIGKNGYLYVLMTRASLKYVIALDKNGNKVWSKEFSGDKFYYAMDHKGDLIVTLQSSRSKVYKLNGATGDILVEKTYDTRNGNAPIVDYATGDFYTTLNNQLTKFDNNLNELWKKTIYSAPTEVAIDKNRDIIFSDNDGVYKLNKDGEQIWKLDYKTISDGTLGLGHYNPAIDKEGKIYLSYYNFDNKGNPLDNLISIGDPIEQPIDFCTYYGSLEKKLNDKTLTKEEQTKAIEQTEKLLERLKSYSAE
ncbi:PQQ-binding-like beta-propeller repeat protein [Bacillus cereus group sp. TH152-1LC]|uniref:PQQ-binding-like beta-propeller repeat protein n=1 Tax=Bacillus cereus group sp. TH152-1LC TaxID=3018060 RepID=UPI0022E83516|nr:PQQ-binding-like beta-propeller repeat protein [Bacillus cereus group sp. TH152-1LC]MDA1675520.1 PQQ-binding-like beta-propeller repeat protein [Bacillus cereus group sp. TH152-1LC]